jgi:hypothetical protein
MDKLLWVRSTGLCFFLAVCLSSCQKKESETAPLNEPTKQLSADELISAMTNDQLVKDYVAADQAFLGIYDNWVAGLSESDRAAHKQAVQAALNSSKGVENVKSYFGTAANEAQYHSLQVGRVQQIKVKYHLNADEQDQIIGKVIRNIIQHNSKVTANGKKLMTVQLTSPDCNSGYSACSFSCYDHGGAQSCYDSCKAGYVACTGG